MTVTLELPPEMEASLIAQAVARGEPLQAYLVRLLAERHPILAESLTPSQRAALWRQSALNLPRTPPLSDQAISRETLYDTRG